MAKFVSRFPELSFYVGGKRKKFVAGQFVTNDGETIKALESIKDVKRVDKKSEELAKEKEQLKTDEEPEESKKVDQQPEDVKEPATKKRKSSAK